MPTFNTISVIGLGYIGLPTSAILASCYQEVIGVDTNSMIVDMVNQGKVHIIEPDLDDIIQVVVNQGKLRATIKPVPADVFIIAVPTPFHEDKSPDLSFVRSAVESIAPLLEKNNLVVLESTSPVGTTEKISLWLSQMRPDLIFPHQNQDFSDIHIAYCPERVLPGRILQELISNTRIIGGLSPNCANSAKSLYSRFVKGQCLTTQARVAELAKLVENAYRDVNIAFANELSLVCDNLHTDVWQVIELANHHPRVNILNPGPGVGGHCIAVDPWFLINAAPQQSSLMKTAREINDYKPQYIVEKILQAINKTPNSPIACFGLSYKPNIDDLRESPAVAIVQQLACQISQPIYVVEPNIKLLPSCLSNFEQVKLVTYKEALAKCQYLVPLVNHSSFELIQHEELKNKEIINASGLWKRQNRNEVVFS